MAALAVPVMAEAALTASLTASLAPVIPLVGSASVLGIVAWKLAAWWKASTAAAVTAKATVVKGVTATAGLAKAGAEIVVAQVGTVAVGVGQGVASTAADTVAITATEATVGGAMGAVTTSMLSMPVLLIAGAAVIAAVGGGYYLYNQGQDVSSPDASAAEASSPSKDPEDGNNRRKDDSEEEDHPFRDKPITMPKKKMKDLLKKHGEKIWEKLRSDRVGTVWKNNDYRVDVGSKLKGRPNMRAWNLQVNGEAKSAAKQLLKTGDTHQKLFWDQFDTVNPPDYVTFVQNILKRFD